MKKIFATGERDKGLMFIICKEHLLITKKGKKVGKGYT